MLSIFIVGWFCNPLHHLQGILNIMGIPCFLSLAYNKIGSTHSGLTIDMNVASYKCPKISKNVLGLSNWRVHDFQSFTKKNVP
jgi:hypothetical protein